MRARPWPCWRNKLRIARGTVQNRLEIEDNGVITSYTVRLRPESNRSASAPG